MYSEMASVRRAVIKNMKRREEKRIRGNEMDRKNHRSHDDDDDDDHANRRVKRYELVSYWELPEYMKDNEYILRHYRATWPLKEALFSIFRWHNETLNVWTHLVGFILFFFLTVKNSVEVPENEKIISIITRLFGDGLKMQESVQAVDVKQHSPTVTRVTRWPFLVFLAGSMFCLLSSSICHLFSCHSHKVNLLLLRVDYVGITIMIITSFFPTMFYIFQCAPHWYFVYLGGISSMGMFTIITLLTPSLSTPRHRTFRAMLFCAMGLFGIVPAVHATIVNWENAQRNVTLRYELAMALFYLIGTGFYVSRVPERWKPGWFDLGGHSHQIFHVFVVLGALAHYGATLLILEWRDRVGCQHIP